MIVRGAAVSVQLTFDRRWAGGYEVVDSFERDGGEHYVLRRLSDNSIVPMTFPAERVRPTVGNPLGRR